MIDSQKTTSGVTPAKAGVQRGLSFLDSGPFDKPFETLRVLSNIEGLRGPSMSRDFRRNDGKWLFRFSTVALDPNKDGLRT
jgi:hypothetical protein